MTIAWDSFLTDYDSNSETYISFVREISGENRFLNIKLTFTEDLTPLLTSQNVLDAATLIYDAFTGDGWTYQDIRQFFPTHRRTVTIT